MILKLYTAAALITAASIVSCAGNNDKEYIDKSVIPPGSETTTAQPVAPVTTTQDPNAVQANTLPGTVNPGTAMPVSVNQQPQSINLNPQNKVVLPTPTQQNITQTAAQTTTAPGMNPPHGQPGHRCDISVGAPLNSKPAPVNTPPPTTVATQQQQPPVTVTQQPTQQKTLPGMNPPHGEPGHRCDISVGAPLNSKPATPAAAPAQTATPPPLLTPVKKDSRP